MFLVGTTTAGRRSHSPDRHPAGIGKTRLPHNAVGLKRPPATAEGDPEMVAAVRAEAQ